MIEFKEENEIYYAHFNKEQVENENNNTIVAEIRNNGEIILTKIKNKSKSITIEIEKCKNFMHTSLSIFISFLIIIAMIKLYRFLKAKITSNNNNNNETTNINNNNNNNETTNNNNINEGNIPRIFQDLTIIRGEPRKLDDTFNYSALLQQENDSKIEIINDKNTNAEKEE